MALEEDFFRGLTTADISHFALEFPTLAKINNLLFQDIDQGLESAIKSVATTGKSVKKKVLIEKTDTLAKMIDFYLKECAVYGIMLRRYEDDFKRGYNEVKDTFQFYVSATVTPVEEGYTITAHTYYSTTKTELGYEVSRHVELICSSNFSSQLSHISEFLTNKSLSHGFEFATDAIKMAGFALLRAGYELQSRND